eukprot:Nitzschia sp. Nitz4//scaffold376_size14603//3467//4495//NITZ4_008918-RA/size14603-processed-gene-0.0-mRNA-1//1//CDS//3329549652//1364//frame0
MCRPLLILFALLCRHAAGHGQMSRHLTTEDLSMVVVMADARATEGPYYEQDSDYIYTDDMTTAAVAGTSGVSSDRLSVLNGIPLTLTVTVYDLSTASSGYADEYSDVEVFLWHTDALGVYSDVDQSRQRTEGTSGQYWLRAYQTTGDDGTVTFNTILPGWYTGRAIHYHVRMRSSGSTNWAATSQFFVNDTARSLYESVEPYSNNTQSKQSLTYDNVYKGLSSSVRDMLVLNLQGSVESGFTAEMELGLSPSDFSSSSSSSASNPLHFGSSDGPGTWLYVVVGLALVGFAIVVVKRRKTKAQPEGLCEREESLI